MCCDTYDVLETVNRVPSLSLIVCFKDHVVLTLCEFVSGVLCCVMLDRTVTIAWLYCPGCLLPGLSFTQYQSRLCLFTSMVHLADSISYEAESQTSRPEIVVNL